GCKPPPRSRSFLLVLTLLLPLPALADPYERFKRGNHDIETLIEVVPQLADPAKRDEIRALLTEADPPPARQLVTLLRHPILAVRLGALEILEELAGGDLTYNPWVSAESTENTAALARWDAWAERPTRAENSELFSEEQRRTYLQDILGEDDDKASRARRMLEAEGFSAVGFLEEFLQATPTLHPGHRTRVREAQYQITLARPLGDQAAITARHLALGSRDQVLAALTTIRSAGLLALPILRDFIAHPDALIREMAIDAMLVTGGASSVPIIAPIVTEEPDVNVIHGVLRRLRDVPGQPSIDLVATFLEHPSEDLLISAIQTTLTLAGDQREISFGRSRNETTASPTDAKVIAHLDDPRWRVRTAALEYIAKRNLTRAAEQCIAMLEDPDDFVRFAAISAISALGAKQALPKLKALFLADDSLAGPVFEGYGNMRVTPDAELLAALDKASTDARLAAVRAAESNSTLRNLLLRFANDPDLDVASAALRAIAGNSSNLENNDFASAIVTALRSGEPAKSEAVLERLSMPRGEGVDPRVLEILGGGFVEIETTALDALYQAFSEPGRDLAAAEGAAAAPAIPQAQAALIEELVRRTTPENPPGDRFRAALNLIRASHTEGFAMLAREMPEFTTAQKSAIAEALYNPTSSEAIPLLTELLRSPVAEVRSQAARAALSNENAPVFPALLLEELMRDGTALEPHEIYGYPFESIVRSGAMRSPLTSWALGVLQDETKSTPLKVLATIAVRGTPSRPITEALKSLATSPDPHLRRAAIHALIDSQPSELNTLADAILADEHAAVRVILPSSLNLMDAGWNHQFSDLHIVNDARWSSSDASRPRLTAELRETLRKLLNHDPSARVRFEAGFALLTQNVDFDVDAFAASVPQVPTDANARRRISRWLSNNAERASPGLRPLLSVVETSDISPKNMQILQRRVQPSGSGGFATFASLAAATAPTEGEGLLEPATESDDPVERASLALVYFFKPGCPECVQAKQFIDAVRRDFPLLDVHEHNILDSHGIVLNQILSSRFSVPSAQHGISPSVFTQGGFIIRDDINPRTLAELLDATMRLAQDDAWLETGEEEEQQAAEIIDRRYAAFTLPIVIGAGLLDGVNPCAFATIIFFLSYLQIARRTPREMLMVGAAFISAVFLAYLAAGLILHQFLATINDRFAGIQFWMNLTFAALALLAAWLSFRDALRARAGRLGDMTLQLPEFLKERIRGTIRKTSRARHFVIAAFISGIIISLLELACTGQVYAPIIYQIQQGNLHALTWLVIYNLAFITPLVVIFLLAYSGLRSETLVTFQKKHTFGVKLALGILFVALAAFILLAPRLL
ncbi:MAG: HEAT repeat domain-containing protein, partial [Luteolibacter sp.]